MDETGLLPVEMDIPNFKCPLLSTGDKLTQTELTLPNVFFYLLRIFLNDISNAIPKVPHTLRLPPTSLPTHSHFLALAFPCTGAYKVCNSNGPLFPVMAN